MPQTLITIVLDYFFTIFAAEHHLRVHENKCTDEILYIGSLC